MHPTYRGLALLLSIGSLPIACNKDSDEPTDSKTGGPDTSSSSADASSTGGSTTGTPTTGDGTTGDSSGTPTEAVTTFLTSNTDTSSGSETGADIPPPTNPACQAYLEHLNECYPRYARYNAYYASYCDMLIANGMRADGKACADAIEAFLACINAIPCKMMQDDSCDKEDAAFAAACPSLGDGDTDTDTGGGSTSSTSSTGP